MHIILFTLFYFCGISLAAGFNFYSLLFFSALIYFCWTKRRTAIKKYFAVFFLFLILGIILTIHQQNVFAKKISSAENYQPEILNLRIVSDVQYKEDTAVFTARADDYKIMARIKNATDLHYGDDLTLARVRLFPLTIRRNFFITSYDDYLYNKGYSLRLNTDAKNVIEHAPRKSLLGQTLRFRNHLAQIQRNTLPPKQAEIMCTLLFGSASSAVDSESLAEYRRAGIIHLLVVSGMHIAIFLSLLQSLANLLRLKRWQAFWLVSLVNVLFVLAVGAGASVLRAGLMAEIALLARVLDRRTDSYNTLALAGLIMALFNPRIIFDVGFQLSCAATFSMVFFVPVLEEKFKLLPEFFRGLLATSIAPLLLTMPLGIYYFQGVSLGALFLNLLILPWTGLLVNLGFVSSFLGAIFLPAATLVNSVNYFLLVFLDWLVNIFAKSYVDLPQIPLALLFLTTGWSFVFALRSQWLKKYTLFVAVFILTWLIYPGSNTLRIIFLDVGQGDCVVLTRRKKALVIDCGSDSGTMAGETLRLTLHKLGISNPDVLLTHAHADHYNGLPDLQKINALVLPRNTPEWLAEDLRAKSNFVTESLDWVRLYQPEKNFSNENNNSRLALLEEKNFRALFTGDAETDEEKLFLDVFSEIDLLKSGHHGSKTSSGAKFLEMLQPKNTIVSVGAGNRYRHPNQEALDRLSVWSNIYRTDKEGAIMITVYPRHYELLTVRSGKKEKFPIFEKYF